jgi:predicted dehydrogenase
MDRVGVAIVGCGNIAAFYLSTLSRHSILELRGVMDRNASRSAAYARYYLVPEYGSLDAMLNDQAVKLVINLTNPRSHFAISKACLEADKHVYSEKPLAMSFPEAAELVRLAAEKGLSISSAPSRILAETGQTMWRALRENVIGRVHAVYAEMDGGLIYRSRYKEWMNEVGMRWPYMDEFEVGCTIEHAGYPLSWLTAFFGPVETVTAFATTQYPDLRAEAGVEVVPPDLTVACLKFKSGVVARLTSSWIAPSDHSMRFFGDTGVLSTRDLWEPKSPVYITRDRKIRVGPKTIAVPRRKKYPFALPPRNTHAVSNKLRSPKALARSLRARFLHLRKRVDFCLGPAELAMSLRERRACRLSPKYCLHNTEIVLAIHNSVETQGYHKMTTTFDPMDPLPWALPRSAGL